MSPISKPLNLATLLLVLASGVPGLQLVSRAQNPPATPPTTQLEIPQLELGKAKTYSLVIFLLNESVHSYGT